MKIAIVSDSHDNLATLEKTLAWLNKENIKILIHCGDVCSPAMLKEMSKNFNGQIHLAFGNVDGDQYSMLKLEKEGELPNVKFYDESGELEIDARKLAFCHKPMPAQGLANSGKYDLVFYGHTHKPWEEKVSRPSGASESRNCRLVNPGTLAGMFNKATFAVYDTRTNLLELKLVERL